MVSEFVRKPCMTQRQMRKTEVVREEDDGLVQNVSSTSKAVLPQSVAEHDHWSGSCFVVGFRKPTAQNWLNAQCCKGI